MPLQISIRVPSDVVSGIQERLQVKIDSARSEMVQIAINAALADVIDHVPIETGKTQEEWQSEFTRIQGSLPNNPSAHTSVQSATNGVPQVVYIEYGTSRMSPRSIVRTALAKLQTVVQSMFRLG